MVPCQLVASWSTVLAIVTLDRQEGNPSTEFVVYNLTLKNEVVWLQLMSLVGDV